LTSRSFDFRGNDRFQLLQTLGQGGMGVVYQAFDRKRKSVVALKMLSNMGGDALLRFKNEFRALADLQHPNLVSLGELMSDGEHWFFTMELVPGVDFLAHVGQGRQRAAAPAAATVGEPGFDEERLRASLAQLARGLMALHRASKVHRDIKPSNVLVTLEGRVVLLDFGFAVDTVGGQQKSDVSVVGTVDYMAPEQAASKPVGPEAALERLEHGARPEEVRAAAARAEAAAAAAQEARSGARSEEIAGARARLETAQAAADKAELDAQRVARLRAAGAISQADADAAALALRSALAQRDVQARALDQLSNGVRVEQRRAASARASEAAASAQLVAGGARAEDLKAARAQVDAARGRLQQVQVMLEELTIRAPRDARVESLDLRPGDLLQPSAPAATLLEAGQLYVRIYVPETLLGRIRVGQEVYVKVDSFRRTFAGVVEHIASVGEYSPRNLQTADERANQVFATRIGLKEGDGVLRAGMAASIQVSR